MLCDECGQRDAVYTVHMMMNGETTERHLCPACMSRMNSGLQGTGRGLLNALLSTLIGSGAHPGETREEEPVPDITCPRCGTTFAQFRKSGHLGCPGCYKAFHEQLQPMLQQIHGRVQHAGRRPLESEDAQRSRSRQEELTRQMEQAVAVEDFETAARLRDQLHALAKEAQADG